MFPVVNLATREEWKLGMAHAHAIIALDRWIEKTDAKQHGAFMGHVRKLTSVFWHLFLFWGLLRYCTVAGGLWSGHNVRVSAEVFWFHMPSVSPAAETDLGVPAEEEWPA